MTYIAFFEGFMLEGSLAEFAAELQTWTRLQGNALDRTLVDEVAALRILYAVDDHAHFDWLFSDVALEEIVRIQSAKKRSMHFSLLDRLIEHRADVYRESGDQLSNIGIAREVDRLLPGIPPRMLADARQFAEANLVDSDFFITCDMHFTVHAKASPTACVAAPPTGIPFVTAELRQPSAQQWLTDVRAMALV